MVELKRINPIERLVYEKQINTRFRNGVKDIKDLKPCKFYKKDNIKRYDWFEMRSIMAFYFACDIQHYSKLFLEYKTCYATTATSGFGGSPSTYRESIRDNLWSEFYMKLFRVQIRNGQANTLYLGLNHKHITKKLGREATQYEMVLHKEFIKMFKHLIVNDRIKVEIWW